MDFRNESLDLRKQEVEKQEVENMRWVHDVPSEDAEKFILEENEKIKNGQINHP